MKVSSVAVATVFVAATLPECTAAGAHPATKTNLRGARAGAAASKAASNTRTNNPFNHRHGRSRELYRDMEQDFPWLPQNQVATPKQLWYESDEPKKEPKADAPPLMSRGYKDYKKDPAREDRKRDSPYYPRESKKHYFNSNNEPYAKAKSYKDYRKDPVREDRKQDSPYYPRESKKNYFNSNNEPRTKVKSYKDYKNDMLRKDREQTPPYKSQESFYYDPNDRPPEAKDWEQEEGSYRGDQYDEGEHWSEDDEKEVDEEDTAYYAKGSGGKRLSVKDATPEEIKLLERMGVDIDHGQMPDKDDLLRLADLESERQEQENRKK